MPMKTLDQIAIEKGADKASIHPVKGHDYSRHYDALFSTVRESARKVMEIGVGSGESMQMWLEYFPNAKVMGVDIVHDTNPWNSCPNSAHPRYDCEFLDQSNEADWELFVYDFGGDWDILVDDGGHSSQQIITTFKMMWPHLRPGGFYAIEDLGCAYSGLEYFCPAGWQNHMDFIKDMLDQINRGQNQIDRLYFANELAILQKKG